MSRMLKNPKYEICALQLAEGKTATEAAIVAGYSEKGGRFRGSRVATNSNISARVQELRARLNEKTVSAIAIARAAPAVAGQAQRRSQYPRSLDAIGHGPPEGFWERHAVVEEVRLYRRDANGKIV